MLPGAPPTDASSADSVVHACPVCGSTRLRSLPGYERGRLTTCRNCDHVFADCTPTEPELLEYYSVYPESVDVPALTRRRYEQLLDEFAAYRDTGRLLDVGCGDGHFLRAARDRGWTVTGTEYIAAAIERGRASGLDVRPAPLEAQPDERGGFDVVTMFEVLEHMSQPRRELERIVELLRPGGLLYLTTPNFSSLARRAARGDWLVIEYPEHLGYFQPATLDRMLRAAGLRRVSLRTTGLSLTTLRRSLGVRSGRCTESGAPAGVLDDQRLRAGAARSRTVEGLLGAANAVLTATRLGDTLKARYVAV